MKKCPACLAVKPPSDFYTKKSVSSPTKVYLSAWCRSCEIRRIGELKKALRRKMVAFGGGKCKACGYNRCIEALEFHHRDPWRKDIAINKIRGFTENVRKELEKCDLLCANCHREAHWMKGQRSLPL